MKKWIVDVYHACYDWALLKLFFYKQDREMAKARKKLGMGKVVRDRMSK